MRTIRRRPPRTALFHRLASLQPFTSASSQIVPDRRHVRHASLSTSKRWEEGVSCRVFPSASTARRVVPPIPDDSLNSNSSAFPRGEHPRNTSTSSSTNSPADRHDQRTSTIRPANAAAFSPRRTGAPSAPPDPATNPRPLGRPAPTTSALSTVSIPGLAAVAALDPEPAGTNTPRGASTASISSCGAPTGRKHVAPNRRACTSASPHPEPATATRTIGFQYDAMAPMARHAASATGGSAKTTARGCLIKMSRTTPSLSPLTRHQRYFSAHLLRPDWRSF